MKRVIPAVAVLLIGCASERLTTTESQMVGTWRIKDKVATADIVFRPDHTATMTTKMRTGESRISPGHWHARGKKFFIDWEDNPASVRAHSNKPGTIIRLTQEELVLAPAGFPKENPMDAQTSRLHATRVK